MPPKYRQEPWDLDPTHLDRLSRLHPGEEASYGDLWNYAQDLNYAEIEFDFLRFCLPFCLAGWQRYFTGRGDEYGAFVEYFYPALVRILPSLRPLEGAAVSEFMRGAILARIDELCGPEHRAAHSRAYPWFAAVAAHGVLFPDIAKLWTPIWKAETAGRAFAWVQYASCLIYGEYEILFFRRGHQQAVEVLRIFGIMKDISTPNRGNAVTSTSSKRN